MSIDWHSDHGKATSSRLQIEPIGWLTTVGARHTPYPSPVWFWWDGDEALVYSQPDTLKLRNIEARPVVTLAVQSDPLGEHFSVLTGVARIDRSHPSGADHAGYRTKYAHLMRHVLDQTPEEFSDDYSVPVLIAFEACRGL